MTVAIPPGQMKYRKINHPASASHGTKPKDEDGDVKGTLSEHGLDSARSMDNAPQSLSNGIGESGETGSSLLDSRADFEVKDQPIQESALETLYPRELSHLQANGTSTGNNEPSSSLPLEAASQEEENATQANGSQDVASDADVDLASMSGEFDGKADRNPNLRPEDFEAGTTVEQVQSATFVGNNETTEPETGCILYQIKTVKSFVDKIIEIDGRLSPKDAPIVSNWRYIRLQRSNQDLGSLFDLREEYYLWTNPTIVKMPKQDNSIKVLQAESAGPKDINKQAPKKGKDSRRLSASGEGLRSKKDSRHSANIAKVRSKTKDRMEESDGDDAIEPESDGDFEAIKPRSKRAASNSRANRNVLQQCLSSKQIDGAAKNTGRSDARAVHERPGHKSHWCPQCGNGFTQPGSLNRHIKNQCRGASKAKQVGAPNI